MENLELTETERKVYEVFFKLARKIGEPENITEALFPNVLKMCSVWNMVPLISEVVEAEQAVHVIKSLIAKGTLKQFEITNLPTFLPLSYWFITTTEKKKVEMDNSKKY